MSPRVWQWIYSSNSILGCKHVIKPCVSVFPAVCVPARMLWCDFIWFHLMWRYLFITRLSCMAPFQCAAQLDGECVYNNLYWHNSWLHGWRQHFKTTEVGNIAWSKLSLCVSLLHPLPLSLFLWGSLCVCERAINHYICCMTIFPYNRLLHIHTYIDLFCTGHACRAHTQTQAHAWMHLNPLMDPADGKKTSPA